MNIEGHFRTYFEYIIEGIKLTYLTDITVAVARHVPVNNDKGPSTYLSMIHRGNCPKRTVEIKIVMSETTHKVPAKGRQTVLKTANLQLTPSTKMANPRAPGWNV